jgi:hypothetical protein
MLLLLPSPPPLLLLLLPLLPLLLLLLPAEKAVTAATVSAQKQWRQKQCQQHAAAAAAAASAQKQWRQKLWQQHAAAVAAAAAHLILLLKQNLIRFVGANHMQQRFVGPIQLILHCVKQMAVVRGPNQLPTSHENWLCDFLVATKLLQATPAAWCNSNQLKNEHYTSS